MKLGLVLGGVAKGYMDARSQLQDQQLKATEIADKKRQSDEVARVNAQIAALNPDGSSKAPTPSTQSQAPSPSGPAGISAADPVAAVTGTAATTATTGLPTTAPAAIPDAATPSSPVAPSVPTAGTGASGTPAPMTGADTSAATAQSNNWAGVQPLLGGQNWPGQNGTDANGSPTFTNPMDGIHAAVANVRTLGKLGINTVGGIADHWAHPLISDAAEPLPDNSTMANHVATVAGITPDTPIDMADHPTVNSVVNGILSHNLGSSYAPTVGSLSATAAPRAPVGALPVPAAPAGTVTPPPAPSKVTQQSSLKAQQQMDYAEQVARIKMASTNSDIAESGARTLASIGAAKLNTIQAAAAERIEGLAKARQAINMAQTPDQVEAAVQPYLQPGQTTQTVVSPSDGSITAYVLGSDGKPIPGGTRIFANGLAADGRTQISALQDMQDKLGSMITDEDHQVKSDAHVASAALAAQYGANANNANSEAARNKDYLAAGGANRDFKIKQTEANASMVSAGAAASNARTNAMEGVQRTQAMAMNNQITAANIADEKAFSDPNTSAAERAQLQTRIAVRNGQLGVQTSQVTGPDGMPQTLFKGTNGQTWTYDRTIGGMVDPQDLGQVAPTLAAAKKQNVPLTYGQYMDPTNPNDTGYAYSITTPSGQVLHGSDPGALMTAYKQQAATTKRGALPTSAAPAAPGLGPYDVIIPAHTVSNGKGGSFVVPASVGQRAHTAPTGRGGGTIAVPAYGLPSSN